MTDVRERPTERREAKSLDVARGATSASAACAVAGWVLVLAWLIPVWGALIFAVAGLAFANIARVYGRPSWSWALSLVALASAIVCCALGFQMVMMLPSALATR